MPALETLCNWVLAGSLRASCLALAILGAQFLLRKRLEARWRYGLWIPVLVVLLLPASAKSRWSVASLTVQAEPRRAPGPHPIQPPKLSSAPPTPAAPVMSERAPSRKQLWELLWAGGALAFGTLSLAVFRSRLRSFRISSIPVPPELQSRITELAHEIGLNRPPRICMTSGVEGPAVCGLWRPTLLIPPDFLSQLNGIEANLVLRHELAHIRRGDLWTHALLWALMALHWFNPILWIAFFRIRMDRESACDANVLHDASKERRAAYGHALLKLESGFPASSLSLGFVGILQRSTPLHSRLELIASPPSTPYPMKTLLLILSATLTFLGVTKAADVRSASAPKPSAPAIRVESIFYQIPEDSNIPEAIANLLILKKNQGPVPAMVGAFSPEQLDKLTSELQKLPGIDKLASPSVITRNGQTAKIELGREVTLETSKRPEWIGVSLSVTPEIPEVDLGKSRDIELALEPRVRSLDESVLPARTFEQTTKTNVGIAHQQTVLLNLGSRKGLVTLDERSGPAQSIEQKSVSYQTLVFVTATYVHSNGNAYTFPPASIQEKLDSILLPTLQLQEANLNDALQYLREMSRKLDPSLRPENKGVNLVLLPKEMAGSKITLQLQNIPLGEALRYVLDQAGMQHRIEKSAVVIEKRSVAQSENQPIEIIADSISNEDGLVSAEGNVTIQTPQGIFKSNAIQIIPAKAK